MFHLYHHNHFEVSYIGPRKTLKQYLRSRCDGSRKKVKIIVKFHRIHAPNYSKVLSWQSILREFFEYPQISAYSYSWLQVIRVFFKLLDERRVDKYECVAIPASSFGMFCIPFLFIEVPV